MKFEEFEKLVRDDADGLVPVYREFLSDTLTPTAAFLRLRGQGEPAFLLESVEGGERIGRYSFLGTQPFRSIRATGDRVRVDGADGEPIFDGEGNFFEIFERELAGFRSVHVRGLPPFTGGAVGYISYDAIRFIERIPDRHPREDDLPDAQFHFYDTIVAFDHARHRMFLIAYAKPGLGDARTRFDEAHMRINYIESMLSQRAPNETVPARVLSLPRGSIEDEMRSNLTREEFEASVRRAKEYIAAGDAFQIVLSQRFEREVKVDPFQVYRALRALNPSPYLSFLQWGETAVLCSSPETLVKVENSKVTVRPIAGTRPRGETPEEDAAHEADLLSDEKELAEHRMLVDLGRNDVGRVSSFGTVNVSRYLTIERYSHVMHIVSEVEGRLREGLSALDAFQAGFPAGTLSGAPKIRAMEIIDELEGSRRGIYAGAAGYVDFAGNLDTCIAIRTIVFHRGQARAQAGAGIVADSVPSTEFMETVHKATPLLEAIRHAEAQAGARGERDA